MSVSWEVSSTETSPGRLNMGVVYPHPDPIHFNSHRCGQDHGMRLLPARFQSHGVMSLNPDFITWFKTMGVSGRNRPINLADGRPELLSDPMEVLQKTQRTYIAIFSYKIRLAVRQH